MTTIYVSIGNTDGKLTHQEWSEYFRKVNDLLTESRAATAVYGVWHSLPATPYVNACWAVEIPAVNLEAAKDVLRTLARRYRQDSIAFATATTEFLSRDASQGSGHE